MGVLAPVFSVLFFLMMISLGFGTEVNFDFNLDFWVMIALKFLRMEKHFKFSIMESVLSAVVDLFHHKLNTPRKKYILRICFCAALFLLGLVMVTRV